MGDHLHSLVLKFCKCALYCADGMVAVTLDQLLKQENIVLEFWTTRKRRIDQCQQYVVLETSAKQVATLYCWYRKDWHGLILTGTACISMSHVTIKT